MDDPSDSGGETNHGITVAVARSFGYEGPMEDLPVEVSFEILVAKYWDVVLGDKLARLSESVTEEVVDTAVNMGHHRATKFLQRSLNALNKRGYLYQDLKVDGRIGFRTVSALRAYLSVRDEEVLRDMLDCLQGAFYVELSERREKDETFIYGWFKNRIGV